MDLCFVDFIYGNYFFNSINFLITIIIILSLMKWLTKCNHTIPAINKMLG